MVGMIAPMALIIILAIIWIMLGKPLQINLTMKSIFPSFGHAENWISLTAIMTAFLGMELATVHVQDVKNPQRTFPKALYFSVILILITMILGSLAIAFVLPVEQINLMSGVAQAFENFFRAYHMAWVIPIIIIMLLIGSFGGIINWVISPAKGLLQAAELGYLPRFFRKVNAHGVASNLLITQAVLVSLICLVFLLIPSVNGSYWLLTALSTQLYMLMYVLMFFAAIYLRYKYSDTPRAFQVPGGKFGMWSVCILGVIGCLITLVVGFFPPAEISVGGFAHYELVFCSGIVVMILPIIGFYFYKAKFAQSAC